MKKIGILGGGQLGRMFIQSALDWNIETHILDPDPLAPCSAIAHKFTCGSLTDYQSVYQFGQNVDIVSIEIENVNTEALIALQKEGKKVFPQPQIIQLFQDKRTQKQFYLENQIPTADFVLTENKADLQKYTHFLPAMHKLGKAGYDGRGVQKIATENDFEKGFDAPSLLEKLVDFDKEIAVIVARNQSGEVRSFPVVEMVFHPELHLVEYLFSPANISEKIAKNAQEIAEKILRISGFVGLLAVEMFVCKDGKVLVNEVAPRPHNSGHQTIEGNFTSQYQQHLRAILDLPLGSPENRCFSAMINLLGEDGHQGKAVCEGLEKVLAKNGVFVHLYGKTQTKPFRKMGHVTVLDNSLENLQKKASWVKENLKIVSE